MTISDIHTMLSPILGHRFDGCEIKPEDGFLFVELRLTDLTPGLPERQFTRTLRVGKTGDTWEIVK